MIFERKQCNCHPGPTDSISEAAQTFADASLQEGGVGSDPSIQDFQREVWRQASSNVPRIVQFLYWIYETFQVLENIAKGNVSSTVTAAGLEQIGAMGISIPLY
eukprot:GHVS01036824.1.p1 GENE.GHVS01036824.1~~GHVS01036824.1.p1  ORF type:complete len:104 (+),score=1.11 GHVS01036824.1:168-479(+)